jgi:3-deoxy-7-phosphoheptulonate synthase
MSETIDELLMGAEYIMSEGNPNVILCERGIRTFETRTRNTFDVNAIPVVHHLSHLPIIGDPSHSTGYTRYVRPAAYAATAAGADGLEIEVHDNPSQAWSDGAQALTPAQFDDAMRRIRVIREAICQDLSEGEVEA